METGNIDHCIERYAEERQHAPRQIALQHLLGYAYMVNGAGEIDGFLKRVRRLVVFHIESLMLFENPLRNSQICWLLLFPIGFAYSLYLAAHHELSLLGLIYCAGTLIYGTSLLVMIIDKWYDLCIRIAYYREIIEFIDSRQYAPAS